MFSGKSKIELVVSNFLVFGCLSFLFGVSVFVFLDWQKVYFFVFGLLVLIFIFNLIFQKSKKIFFLFFIFLFFCLGGWKVEIEKNKIYKNINSVQRAGFFSVSELPERKDGYQKIIGCFSEKNDIKKIDCDEKTLLFGDSSEVFNFGDYLELNCQMILPENKYEKFNYVRYLAGSDIYQICLKPKIIKKKSVLESNLSEFNKFDLLKFHFLANIYNIRNSIEKNISKNFSEPGASYLAGLLLGGDDRLTEDVSEDFKKTGTTHTVAVSGYNIAIIATFLTSLGIFVGFWRQKAFWLSLIGITFFILMIGSPSAAVRAAIMGILMLWASSKGKLSNSWRAIVLVAFLMVWNSPFILIYDVSFQLSFLATISLIFLYTPFADKFEIKNDFLEIKSILLMTAVAQMGVLGLMIYVFGNFSLVSFLANLVIIPLVPFIMLGGFIVIVLSFVFPFLSSILAIPVQFLLDFIIWLVSFLAQFNWSNVVFSNVSSWWLFGYYVFFIGLILKYNQLKDFSRKPLKIK